MPWVDILNLLGFVNHSFIVLCSIFVHVKGLQSEKSTRQMELLSPTENTASALPETPGLELNLLLLL